MAHSKYLDEVAEAFDAMCAEPVPKAEAFIVEKKFAAAVKGKEIRRVLDLGCGTGGGLELVRRVIAPLEFVGIDLSPGMLEQFSKRSKNWDDSSIPKVELIQGDMNDRSLIPSRDFDLLLSTFGSFSYVDDPTALLSFLKENHLTSHAILFLMVCSRLSATNLLQAQQTGDRTFLEKKRPYAYRGIETSLHDCPVATFYTVEEIEGIIRSVGLNVIETIGLHFNSPDLAHCASMEAAVRILEREMIEEPDKNRAHSLLCIAENT